MVVAAWPTVSIIWISAVTSTGVPAPAAKTTVGRDDPPGIATRRNITSAYGGSNSGTGAERATMGMNTVTPAGTVNGPREKWGYNVKLTGAAVR
jgi:hypothetical protein